MTRSAGLTGQTLFTTAQVAERLQLPISTIRGAIPFGDSSPSCPRHGAAVALLVGVLTLLVGCGGNAGRATPRATVTQGAEGRPIGGQPTPGSRAVATSLRFVRGYLAFQAGRLTAEQVPDATGQLRGALRRLRVPPAAKDRRTEVIAAKLERLDRRSARVTVQVRNVDERLDYPLPIDLISRPSGRWAVLSAGD